MEVPAYVQHESQVQTGIQVRGGTNYDLSRSAVPTPLTPIRVVEPPPPAPVPLPKNLDVTEYLPVDGMPSGQAKSVVEFGRNSAVLPAGAVDAKTAKSVRAKAVVVAGHADSGESDPAKLAKARADAVAKALKKYGAKPQVKAFAADRELTDVPEYRTRNRRAEVFVVSPKTK